MYNPDPISLFVSHKADTVCFIPIYFYYFYNGQNMLKYPFFKKKNGLSQDANHYPLQYK